jgi:hypothetical protein
MRITAEFTANPACICIAVFAVPAVRNTYHLHNCNPLVAVFALSHPGEWTNLKLAERGTRPNCQLETDLPGGEGRRPTTATSAPSRMGGG